MQAKSTSSDEELLTFYYKGTMEQLRGSIISAAQAAYLASKTLTKQKCDST